MNIGAKGLFICTKIPSKNYFLHQMFSQNAIKNKIIGIVIFATIIMKSTEMTDEYNLCKWLGDIIIFTFFYFSSNFQ